MRIYGKTLTEIFGLLPWAYKAVVTMGAAFFLFAVPYSLHYFITMGVQIDKVEPLNFPGLNREHNKGVMDPAIATDGSNVLMAHTVLSIDTLGTQQQVATEVVLERSTKPCKLWAFIGGGYKGEKDDVMGPDNVTPLSDTGGIWRYETPGIVYDPDDRGREWKLYAYRYYWTGSEAFARHYGFIAEKTAPSPDGPWTDQRMLFSASKDQPGKPFEAEAMGQTYINDLSPELQDIYFYSRPSVVYNKFLFMTLSAFINKPGSPPDRIVMLKSVNHGKTWSYAGTPLRGSDLAKMGNYTKIGGATLVKYNDKMYLAVVLGDKTADGLGTFMIPFENPAQGLLARDPKTGAPIVAQHHPRNSNQPSRLGGGYTAYTDACSQGMLTSEYSDLRASFQIFKTYKKPILSE